MWNFIKLYQFPAFLPIYWDYSFVKLGLDLALFDQRWRSKFGGGDDGGIAGCGGGGDESMTGENKSSLQLSDQQILFSTTPFPAQISASY